MTIFDSQYVIAGGHSGDIRVVNLSTGSCVHMMDSEPGSGLVHVNLLVTLNDDLLVAGSPWIRLVSLSQLGADTTRKFQGHTRNVTCLDFEPTGSKWFVSGGEDGLLRIWDLRARGFQTGIEHSVGINAGGKLHPNHGAFIFGDANGFVNEWDLAANQICRKSMIGTNPVGLGVHTMCIDYRRSNAICAHNNREVSVFSVDQINNLTDKINLVEESTPTSILSNPISTPRKFGNKIEPLQTFAADIHSSYISNLNIGNTFQSLAVSSGDGSVSIWRSLDDVGTWTLDNVMRESDYGNTGFSKWCWDAFFCDPEERFVMSAHADGVCNLWDTARHVSTPIAAYDCGGGKSVNSIVLVGDATLNSSTLDRRHRVVK